MTTPDPTAHGHHPDSDTADGEVAGCEVDAFLDQLKADAIALSHEEPDGTGLRPTMAAYRPDGTDAFNPVANTRAAQAYIAAHCATWQENRAYQHGMQLARGDDPEPDLAEFRLALGRGERWPLDALSDDALDVLYGELDSLRARGNPETWERQGVEIAKQAREIGELGTQLDEAADEIAERGSKVKQLTEQTERVRHLADDMSTWLAPHGLDGPTLSRVLRDALDGRLWQQRLAALDQPTQEQK